MAEMDVALGKVMAEANAAFAKMGQVIEEAVKAGATELNVVEITRRAGFQLDERILDELHMDRIIYPLPWLPWYQWWPWRPLRAGGSVSIVVPLLPVVVGPLPLVGGLKTAR